jgi:leader peptidase (prepilin peptidase)/N-methyltransferase
VPSWLGATIAFLYGITIGSFLNVCIYRLPADESVVTPPSHCPKCNTKLKGWDLVPLFSFLWLGRKCRYCGVPISWRYFVVEIITGLLFAATFFRYGMSIDFVAYALFIAALIVAFAVDMDLFIIPDQVSIVGIIVGVGRDVAHWVAGDLSLVRVPLPWLHYSLPIPPCVAGFIVCGGIFYLIAYVSFFAFRPKDEKEREEYEGAMGGGDVKLAAAMGAVLGIVPALASFLIAVVLGTLFGVALVIIKSAAEKKGMPWRTEIPFGPYMVTGALVVILAYPQLQLAWSAWMKLVTPG